jgi:DnaJ-class molecular chaperone
MSDEILLESPILSPESTDPAVCWRCAGTGAVTMGAYWPTGAAEGEKTPCGACLGTKIPPKPCPECGSRKVKVAYTGAYCMRCRDCGHCGPSTLGDLEAYEAWQKENS